jgi:hypothetical protein
MDTLTSRNAAASARAAAKWAYWITGLVVIGAISYFFYSVLNKQIAGVLFFLAGVAAMYFYWVKWFVVPERGARWPPRITPCPDYLTQVMDAPQSGARAPNSYKCYDYVGVSRTSGGITKTPVGEKPNVTSAFLPVVMSNLDTEQGRRELRIATMNKGLSWSTLFGND